MAAVFEVRLSYIFALLILLRLVAFRSADATQHIALDDSDGTTPCSVRSDFIPSCVILSPKKRLENTLLLGSYGFFSEQLLANASRSSLVSA